MLVQRKIDLDGIARGRALRLSLPLPDSTANQCLTNDTVDIHRHDAAVLRDLAAHCSALHPEEMLTLAAKMSRLSSKSKLPT